MATRSKNKGERLGISALSEPTRGAGGEMLGVTGDRLVEADRYTQPLAISVRAAFNSRQEDDEEDDKEEGDRVAAVADLWGRLMGSSDAPTLWQWRGTSPRFFLPV